MVSLKKEQLKERASSLVQLPKRFQSVIEEYLEGENGEGKAIFSWADEQQEEGISITLDLNGNLTSLSIERNKKNPFSGALNVGELKEKATAFLCSHYPHILQDLTLHQTKQLTDAYRFYYEQLIMDLPLPQAGCYIDVEPSGEIINFEYYGLQPKPILPKTLIEKEKLMEHVQKQLDFQLIIANLNSAIHDISEDGLHLVYAVDLFMDYPADAHEPILAITPEEDYPSKYISLPAPTNIGEQDFAVEVIIGIPEEMEIIRKVDLGKETGIVWRERNWKKEEMDLSIDSYFQSRNEGTVKAFISKESQNVRAFAWFKERSGNLRLDREECYQIAIDFLQKLTPNYYQYLQLIVHDDEIEDSRMKEVFTFRVHNGQGIVVFLELVRISVNRETGLIDHYSGPGFDLELLKEIPTEPIISKTEAHNILLESLDFELAWNKNYGEEETYSLVYQPCDRHTGKAIRYIDVLTGAVITEKE